MGNKSLREKLKWSEDRYWKVQGELIKAGLVVPGRGRGGSVALTEQHDPGGETDEKPTEIERIRERDLYTPIVRELKEKWVKTRKYEQFVLEETHSQGSRKTGGTYSRPDVAIVGFKKYIFLPQKDLEVVTFEIKPKDQVNVLGVLEAISHREAAH
jgi:hypothetical protein